MRNAERGRSAARISHVSVATGVLTPGLSIQWRGALARISLATLLLTWLSTHASAGSPLQQESHSPGPAQVESLLLKFQAAPLAFEQNVGQTDSRVNFLARGTNYQLFLSGPHATIKLTKRSSVLRKEVADPTKIAAVRIRWLGTHDKGAPTGVGQLPGRANYFRGGDKALTLSDIPTYERVRYGSLYPDVDLVYYATQGQLEYDLIVAPGGDPTRIRFALDGAQRTSRDREGNLVMHTQAGNARLHRPVVYQLREGARQPVEARYVLDESGEYRIALGAYDRSSALTIDPVLTYGSYLGGTSTNRALAIAVDSAGSAYVAGLTASADFPVVSAYKSTLSGTGDTDAFITKFNPSGSALTYSTYLGGVPASRSTTSQRVTGIAVDGVGSAFVTGTTNASSFPVTAGAYQTTASAGGSFVTKLSPSGSALTYSTYVINATTTALAVDASGNAYITGTANSVFKTTAGAFQGTFRSTTGGTSAFVATLNATGTAMRYASFLGGSGSDSGSAIAVDANGNAFVAGSTSSADFPTTVGAYQPVIAGQVDGFLTKVNPSGTGFVFSTFFGGSLDDHINGVAVDISGAPYLIGETYSTNLPFRNAFQQQKSGRNLINSSLGNVFVAKLFPAGDALAYGSFLGGEICSRCQSSFSLQQYQADWGQGIAVDSTGHAYITGIAQSYTFPLVNSLIANQGADLTLQTSAFLAKIGIAGNSVLYNTLTTTDSGKNVFSVAVDSAVNAYGAGSATAPGQPGSIDLVAPGSYMSVPNAANGGGYALIYKLASTAPSMTLTSSTNPVAALAPLTLSASVADSALTGTVVFYDGSSVLGSATLGGGAASLTTSLSAGVHRLTAVYRSSAAATDTALLHEVVNPALVCK